MRKRNTLIVSLILLLLLVSCGKKGMPLPKRVPLPGGINDLSGEVKDGVLFLSFSIPSKDRDGSELKDLAGFEIRKRCGSCLGDFEPLQNVRLDEKKGYTIYNGRAYVYDDDLMVGFQYSYKVYAYTKRGSRSEESNVFSVQWFKPPGPPDQVSAKPGDGTVELTWSKEPGLSYNVYRSEGNAYALIPFNKRPINTGYFIDTGLENGRTYRYEVRALKEIQGAPREGGGFRADVTPKDTTPPGVPAQVLAEKKGKNVEITWRENSDKDLAGYNVYRTDTGQAKKLNREPLKERVFLDKSVPDLRYVSYYVTAVDTWGNESQPSRESTIILKE
jgi:fibronectin type 3 domain-containing protein